MKISDKSNCTAGSAVVIGKFDGVHKGHQKLFSVAREIAERESLIPTVYTFSSCSGAPSITDDEEKIRLFKQNGIKAIHLQQFTPQFKSTSPDEFVQLLKEDFSAKHVIIGFNFRFGKNRSGSAEDMAALCEGAKIKATIVEPVIFGGKPISSTRIRTEAEAGNMENVFAMMGRYFCITARVTKGKQLGRQLGFPTANLNTESISLLPKSGVYATRIHTDGSSFPAITNIGTNPTVDSDNSVKIENHLIGFSGDLYGKTISVEFLQFLRDEEQFVSTRHLTDQLQCDSENAVKIFRNLLTD